MLPASRGVEFVDALPVAHLPLVRAVIDELGIRETVDELLPMDSRNVIADSDCVSLMILNILEGRVALYNMEKWLKRTDAELLFGAGCPTDSFNDARLASCLDHIAEKGTDNLFSGVVASYLARSDMPCGREHVIHNDTTSIKLFGAYEPTGEPRPARGYSKDRRPDLKQLVFGLSLHGAVGVPLTCSMLAGNTSDHVANRLHIEQLDKVLPEQDEATLVADCKLVDPVTVGKLLHKGFHFVSLLPGTYKLRHDLIEEVRQSGHPLAELHRSAGRTKSSPPRVYSGRSVVRDFKVTWPTDGTGEEAKPEYEQIPMRFLVVESTQLGEKEEAALDRKLERERARFATALNRLAKRAFACAADAEEAQLALVSKLAYHRHHLEVVEETVTLPRKQRGRPPKNATPPPTKQVFRIVERAPLEARQEAVEKLRFHARHYVLLTDHVDDSAWPDERILAEYRHQHMIEGHTGFRWLKNVADVAPVFLHTPHRIAALGVVFVLALMVRNYIQFTLRRRLEETGEAVPSRLGRPTRTPTTETAFIPFAPALVIHTKEPGRPTERATHKLGNAAQTILRMLNIDASVFTTPPNRIFPRVAGGTSGM